MTLFLSIEEDNKKNVSGFIKDKRKIQVLLEF